MMNITITSKKHPGKAGKALAAKKKTLGDKCALVCKIKSWHLVKQAFD